MNNSIEILKQLINKYFPDSTLNSKVESDDVFAEELLLKLLEDNIKKINENLISLEFNTNIKTEFLDELVLYLANSTPINNDKFIQFLLHQKNKKFLSQIEEIDISKQVIKKIERENLKSRFKSIETDNLNISDEDIEKTIQLNNRSHLKKQFKELAKSISTNTTRVFKLNSFIKYAAIFLLIPISIIVIYLNVDNQTTKIASNNKQKILNKNESHKDSVNLILDLKSISTPLANKSEIILTPIKDINFDSIGEGLFVNYVREFIGFADSNEVQLFNTQLTIINIGLQIEDIKEIWVDKLNTYSNKNEINRYFKNVIDSISALNFNYFYDEKNENLTLYSITSLNQRDINLYNTYESFNYSIIKIKNKYYKLEKIKMSKPLKEIKDLEIIEYCNDLE